MRAAFLMMAMALAPAIASATQYAKVAIVTVGGTAGGGDYASPLEALSALASWCGTPSEANRCLVKVMPGVYDIGPNYMRLQKPYLDIEGSGSDVTVVRGTGTSYGILRFSSTSNNEVRGLSLEKTGSGQVMQSELSTVRVTDSRLLVTGGANSFNYAVVAAGPGTLTLDRVTVSAVGTSARMTQGIAASGVGGVPANVIVRNSTVEVSGSTESIGVASNDFANVQLVGSTVRVTGGDLNTFGVYNDATMTISSSSVSVSGARSWAAYNGMTVPAAVLKVDASQLTGVTTVGIGGGYAYMGATRLDGWLPSVYPSGVKRCAACYTGVYQVVNANCE